MAEIQTLIETFVTDMAAALGAEVLANQTNSSRVDATASAGDADALGGAGAQNLEKIGRRLLKKAIAAQRAMDNSGATT